MTRFFKMLCQTVVLACAAASAGQAQIAPPGSPLYSPVADQVYLQEAGEQFVTEQPVTAVAVRKGVVYAVVDGELHTIVNGSLALAPQAPPSIRRLFVLNGDLWLTTHAAVYRFESDTAAKVFDEPMVDLCVHLGRVHGATPDDVWRWEEGRFVSIRPADGWQTTDSTVIREDGTQVLADPVRIGPIQRLASYSQTLHLLRQGGLALIDGHVLSDEFVDWGSLPSPRTRDMRVVGSRLFVGTDKGLGVLRGAALTTLDGDIGLPSEDVTRLAPGFANDLWIGAKTGAMRYSGDEFHYFGAEHWLPGNHVRDIAVEGRCVCIATDQGIGVIRYLPFTLQKKAALFTRSVEQREHKRLGFVHRLYHSPAENAWLREISDNDGGHTAHYLAAMCFRYAVTKDDDARRAAQDAFEALQWLRTITGVEGLIARAVWVNGVDQGLRAERGSGGLPAKWFDADDKRWSWKGDTSSDEVNAHFYAVSLYHDLVASDDQRQRAAEHLASIAKHIVDNGWALRDPDGETTRWGRWGPEYLLRPYGFGSRGLNGMEAQAYAWTALQLSGENRYSRALDQLVQWRYHTYTVREKLTFPPADVVPWDDELAFRCFLPLISYCSDDYLKSIYLRALERHWEVMRMQKIPFFNFIYGGLTGNDCEAPQAVQHLREWSLDTVSHSYRNSQRSDLRPEPGYPPYMGGTKALSPRELACDWGSRSAIHYDGGAGGRAIVPPVGWLEDYWMGRFFGMIDAPRRDDPDLDSDSGDDSGAERTHAQGGQVIGASPYAGPPRPTAPQ